MCVHVRRCERWKGTREDCSKKVCARDCVGVRIISFEVMNSSPLKIPNSPEHPASVTHGEAAEKSVMLSG